MVLLKMQTTKASTFRAVNYVRRGMLAHSVMQHFTVMRNVGICQQVFSVQTDVMHWII